jgi:hypothetical protein
MDDYAPIMRTSNLNHPSSPRLAGNPSSHLPPPATITNVGDPQSKRSLNAINWLGILANMLSIKVYALKIPFFL